MKLLEDYKKAKEDLLQSMNVPDGHFYRALEDHTDVIWTMENTELYWGSEDTEEYSNECRSIMFRGEDICCVAVSNCCSSEIYIMILDNEKEVK